MLSEWSPIVLQLSLLMIVGGILGVISWIGYMMATTKSSPSSIIQRLKSYYRDGEDAYVMAIEFTS